MGSAAGSVMHSVVLANYNGGPYLHDAIRSVLSQQEVSFELILVDDGSTDGSLEVMNAAARMAPDKVRVIDHGRNRGQGAGFNSGLAATRGELISFIDSDDLWYADKLLHVERAFQHAPKAVLHHHDLHVMRHGEVTDGTVLDMMAMGDIASRWRRTKSHPKYLPRFAPTAGLSLPRWVLEKIGPCPEVRVCADMWLTFAPLGFGPVSASLAVKGAYRVHEGNNYFGGTMDIWELLYKEMVPAMETMFQRHGVKSYIPDPAYFPAPATALSLSDRLLDLSLRKVLKRFSGSTNSTKRP